MTEIPLSIALTMRAAVVIVIVVVVLVVNCTTIVIPHNSIFPRYLQ